MPLVQQHLALAEHRHETGPVGRRPPALPHVHHGPRHGHVGHRPVRADLEDGHALVGEAGAAAVRRQEAPVGVVALVVVEGVREEGRPEEGALAVGAAVPLIEDNLQGDLHLGSGGGVGGGDGDLKYMEMKISSEPHFNYHQLLTIFSKDTVPTVLQKGWS